jgi:hypothetical protein
MSQRNFDRAAAWSLSWLRQFAKADFPIGEKPIYVDSAKAYTPNMLMLHMRNVPL